MSVAIYLSTVEPNTGKAVISLGMMETLLKKTGKVGYFKPIITDSSEEDSDIKLLLELSKSKQTYPDTYCFSMDQVSDLVESGRTESVIEDILYKYKKLEPFYDVMLIEGTDFIGENNSFEFDLNAEIARNLNVPVLMIGSALDKTPKESARQLRIALDAHQKHDCEVIGAILNRVSGDPADYLAVIKEKLNGTESHKVFSVIPEMPILSAPMMDEVAKALEAEVLFGEGLLLEKQMLRVSIAGMQLQNYLDFITEHCVVVTPSDRVDVLLGALQANQSRNYPNISGIILTGALELHPSVKLLLEGLSSNSIPILKVKPNTFDTALQLSNIKPKLHIKYQLKLDAALNAFNTYVDVEHLTNKIKDFKSTTLTPKMFNYQLIEKAKSDIKHIVLPEGRDPRVLAATEKLIKDGIVKLTLLGDSEAIKRKIKTDGYQIPLDQIKIWKPSDHPKFGAYTQALFEARKHKGVTLNIAEDLMNDVSYFGTMMVHLGDADGMVSGAVNTTQHTIRPALQFVKTQPGVQVVSSVFFMCLEDRVLVYGDCAVNPNPTAEELAEIAISSSETAASFGLEPRIAMLSYSSGASGKGAEVEKVRKATDLVKALRPDLLVEGPIQYDAAVDASIGQAKMPDSLVAGRANVLIFPDLNTGNNTYKAVQRETKALAIGPVLQGLNKPVNDLSRGCTVEDIINTVIITAIQAQK